MPFPKRVYLQLLRIVDCIDILKRLIPNSLRYYGDLMTQEECHP